jgi:hypothetical protein
MKANKRSVFIRHILDTTLTKDVPQIVKREFDGDFKLYLYTLSTSELGDIILSR